MKNRFNSQATFFRFSSRKEGLLRLNSRISIERTTGIKRIWPRLRMGLSEEEVAKRKELGFSNEAVDFTEKKIWHIVAKNVFSLFNLIYFIIAACLISVGSYKNCFFLGVIFFNMAIGMVQEIRAKWMLKKLSLVVIQKVKVIRSGKIFTIPCEKLVCDDLVLLRTAQQVMVDCVIRLGSVEVNEAAVTGESECIVKKPGNLLISGGFIVSGECCAQVLNVGRSNYINQMTKGAQKYKKYDSEVVRAIRLTIKILSCIILPLGCVLFLRQYNISYNPVSAIEGASAAVLSMIPEGFVLLTSVAFMTGALKLAKEKVLVQELYSLEILSSIDVVCLDKTGTITTNQLELCKIIPCRTQLDPKSMELLLVNLIVGLDDVTNKTFCALKEYVNKILVNVTASWCVQEVVHFSSATKWSGVTFKEFGTFIFGAPEIVLSTNYEKYKEEIEEQMKTGKRVVALVCVSGTLKTWHEAQIVPIAIFSFSDVIRTNARMVISFLNERNVEIKVLSGDNPLTVARIAEDVGIMNSSKYLDVSDVSSLDYVANNYAILGRLTPNQKRSVVKTLSKNHKVAMIGDGVNDVLALKEADCSISFASASPPARQVSQMVLMNDDFSLLPNIVREGQQIVNNMQRSGAMFFNKVFFSVLLSMILLFWGREYPFMPLQTTLINAFTIGIPAFVLSFEPCATVVSGSLLVDIIVRSIPGAVTGVINIVVIYFFAGILGLSVKEVSSLCVLTVAFVNLCLLYRIFSPVSKLRKMLWRLTTGAFVLAAVSLRGFLELEYSVKLLLLFPVLGVFSFFILKFLFSFVPKVFAKLGVEGNHD
ncbi:MAG: HAD-IC family P-type ATPase [Oscillospiraceae bacterium]|jgi:cation-transporting ATPase E|nr:HAD-IC family P-type ATPase [Oscillospiraceae bacterium]